MSGSTAEVKLESSGSNQRTPEEIKEEVNLESSGSNQRTPEEVKEEKRLILEQVEYYFGDKNYPKDRFLKELSGKDPQGWVPIAIIRQFRKMQVYKEDDLIVEALRESPELLEVDESGTKVRRKTPILLPIPEYIKSTPMWSSIYAKGFSKTSNRSLKNEVTTLFQKHGKVIKVKERLNDQNEFKGSFFIQFDSHETAKKISEMKLEFKGTPIKIMMKFDYCEMKCTEKGMDPNTMRKQGQKKNKDGAVNKALKFKKGCLLKFEGSGPAATWETIRKKMDDEYGKVLFVSFNTIGKNGIIHFEEAIAGNVATKIPNDNLELDGVKPSVSLVEGQEEIDYYQRKREYSKAKKQSEFRKARDGNGKKNRNESTPNIITAPEVCSTSAAISESKQDDDANLSEEAKIIKSDPEKTGEGLDQSIIAPGSASAAGGKRKLDSDANLDDSTKPTKSIKPDPDVKVKDPDSNTIAASDASSVSAGSKRKLNDSTDLDDSPKENKTIKLEAEDSNS